MKCCALTTRKPTHLQPDFDSLYGAECVFKLHSSAANRSLVSFLWSYSKRSISKIPSWLNKLPPRLASHSHSIWWCRWEEVIIYLLFFNQWNQECLLKTLITISNLIVKGWFLNHIYNLTTRVKSRSGWLKNNILLLKRNVMWDSGQICRLKFPAPSVAMLRCERLTGGHFLTVAVLASDEPAMLPRVSPLRLVRKPSYRWQTDRPSDRRGGLRRWMGVRGWNLREVQKNKGQLKVAIPTPPSHS